MFRNLLNKLAAVFKINKNASSSLDSDRELYIGNLEYHTKPFELRKLYEKYGKIESLKIIRDPRTKKSKGYGFVKFYNHKAANAALKYTKAQNFRGRELKVAFAKEKDD